MIRRQHSVSLKHFGLLLLALLALGSAASAEWKEKVLYSFQGGSDGSVPAGGVVFDPAGNLYGVTNEGGSTCHSPGCGTIFQLSPGGGGAWAETILYGFNGTDGSYPGGGVIIDAAGNLYGTTSYGGNGPCKLLGYVVGCGVVYELSPPTQKGGQWTYAILYNFQGGNDGDFPNGDLVFDAKGNLYGATQFGGGKGTTCNILFGGQCGTVFMLSPPKQKGGKWTEKVLHSFAGGTDGANPNGRLLLHGKGSIYGTTTTGGNQGCKSDSGVGCGTAFKLAPPSRKGGGWTETFLHVFGGIPDGGFPTAGMVFHNNGDLYGTSQTGGGGNFPSGTVFQLSHHLDGTWKERVLYSFQDGNDGGWPEAVPTFGASGSLYGTAAEGGTVGGGTVFRFQPTGKGWELSVLYTFTGPPDGSWPASSLIFDAAGSLYGTTQYSGTGTCGRYGCGTVFEVGP
jgi:uncharacterized repeat protein (TIGR03803 family)